MFEPISFTHRCPKGLRVAILPGQACPGCGEKAPEATVTTDLVRIQTQKLLLAFSVMAAEDQFTFYAEEHGAKVNGFLRSGDRFSAHAATRKELTNLALAKQLGDALRLAASTTATPAEMLAQIDHIRASAAARKDGRHQKH